MEKGNKMNEVINRLLDDLKKSHEQHLLAVKNSRPQQNEHRSTETKDLYAALAKAQGEMPTASLNASNPYFKTKYTDLAEIVRVSRPSLSKHGLSVTQQLISDDSGANTLVTTLGHVSGQYVQSSMRILPPKSDIQTLGSYISYLRRYQLASLLGVVSSDEDDDGEIVVADQRALLAKGPAQSNYSQKSAPYEPISREQLDMLEDELAEMPDLAEDILLKMQIQSLADMKKSLFKGAIDRIRQIKLDRTNSK